MVCATSLRSPVAAAACSSAQRSTVYSTELGTGSSSGLAAAASHAARGEQVMPAGQVGLLVGDQRGPAAVVQVVKQAAGDDDAARRAGQRVGLDGRARHDHDAVVGTEPGGAPV